LGRRDRAVDIAAYDLLHRRVSEKLSRYDAVHGGFGETELSGNDAYIVAFDMQLADFLAIYNHTRTTSVLSSFFAAASNIDSVDVAPYVGILRIVLSRLCVLR
jgi:hypothetical protein